MDTAGRAARASLQLERSEQFAGAALSELTHQKQRWSSSFPVCLLREEAFLDLPL